MYPIMAWLFEALHLSQSFSTSLRLLHSICVVLGFDFVSLCGSVFVLPVFELLLHVDCVSSSLSVSVGVLEILTFLIVPVFWGTVGFEVSGALGSARRLSLLRSLCDILDYLDVVSKSPPCAPGLCSK